MSKSGYRGQLKSGRPTTREATNKKISEALKISEEEKAEYIKKLEEAAEWDCSLEEMCLHAGISYDTFNRWQKENPKLGERIKTLRETPTLTARKTAVSKIPESYNNAMDYLKRKRKQEFSERQEMTGAEGKDLPTPILQVNVLRNNSDKENKEPNQED